LLTTSSKSKVITMKTFITVVAAAALLIGTVGAANAQPGDHEGWAQDQGATHMWSRGDHMGRNDWSGARAVDYRQEHLRAPPRGYEWRESNGQFILAAVATGVVASIILANGR
jgi:Ni/Co efflux regulator RcnB